jgi:hypothetical protein
MTLRPRGREAMLAGAAIAAYIIAVRPWHLRWSATPEEVTRALPGDQLVAQPVTRPPMRSPSVPRPSTSGRSRSSWARTACVVQLPVAGEPGRLQAAQHRPDRPQAAALVVGDLVRLGPDPTRPSRSGPSSPPGAGAAHCRSAQRPRRRAGDLASGAWLGTWAFVLDPARRPDNAADRAVAESMAAEPGQLPDRAGGHRAGAFCAGAQDAQDQGPPGGLRPWARATTAVRPSSGPPTTATLAWSGQRCGEQPGTDPGESPTRPQASGRIQLPVLPQQMGARSW